MCSPDAAIIRLKLVDFSIEDRQFNENYVHLIKAARAQGIIDHSSIVHPQSMITPTRHGYEVGHMRATALAFYSDDLAHYLSCDPLWTLYIYIYNNIYIYILVLNCAEP